MGLAVMILGLVLFLGIHTLPGQRELRARAISAMGEGSYKLVYALISVLGIALIAWGFAHYRASGWIDIWNPPKALKHLTLALIFPAVFPVVAAFLRGHIYTS